MLSERGIVLVTAYVIPIAERRFVDRPDMESVRNRRMIVNINLKGSVPVFHARS